MTKYAGSDGTALAVVPTGRDPYTYSDATGLGLRTSFPTGTWTVVFDGLSPDLDWLEALILWSSDEPQGTSVTVRVRSSNDQINWSTWEDVSNGVDLTATPPGRYLQIEVSLRINGGEVSPVLYDLTVIPVCDEPLPNAIGYRVAIPEVYTVGNDVTMRLFFHRTGPEPDCFVFSLDAARLRHGSDIEVYGDTRWIRLEFPGAVVAGYGEGGLTLVLDLPVNRLPGLGFPADLAATHFLAFELATYIGDGGFYHLVGVEFFESPAGTATLSGATVFTSDDEEFCADMPR
jgi:hypothetical protein